MTETRWIKVIGIGDDGLDGLSAKAKDMLTAAHHIYGGARHLALIGETSAEQRQWKIPLSSTFPDIEELKGKNVVILATGDPMSYGIGVTLGKRFGFDALEIIPNIGAFSLAAARMGWALTSPQTECITLHGRPLENLTLQLRNNIKILALSANGDTPKEVANLLTQQGYGQSQMTVLSHMGGVDEASISDRACDWSDKTTPNLNVICIETVADNGLVEHSRLAGLPDEAFQHDGKMTKREVRASTLALLAPKKDELLWDVGAGCGSIAIEWVRTGGRAIAIENHPERLAMLKENAINLGAAQLKIIEGKAPEKLADLAPPDAIFIGGGLTTEGLPEACWDALPIGGRLVANAVTINGENKLTQIWDKHGGEMTRQAVSRLVKVGPHHGWKPFMPVTQYVVTKHKSSGKEE